MSARIRGVLSLLSLLVTSSIQAPAPSPFPVSLDGGSRRTQARFASRRLKLEKLISREKRSLAALLSSPNSGPWLGKTWKKNLCPPPREKSIIMILIYAPKVSLPL